MPHGHDHSHDESYFLDQFFSIALCGALGGVAVSLYAQDKLQLILASRFHLYVLAGGIALLVLVAIRAVALYKFSGQMSHAHGHAHPHHHHHHGPCGHGHCDHEHDHGHKHEHHEHQHAEPSPALPQGSAGALGLPLVHQHHHEPHHHHDHRHEHPHHHPEHHHHDHHHTHDHPHDHSHGHDDGHSHGWAPWRYTILMLPVVLFMLNLPNEGFSARAQNVSVEDGLTEHLAGVIGMMAPSGGPSPLMSAGFLLTPRYGDGVVPFDQQGRPMVNLHDLAFSELERAAFDPDKRSYLRGKSATIVGKFVAGENRTQFQLVRFKMNCCAADALALKAVLMVNPDWQGEQLDIKNLQQKWVRVTGRIHFFKVRGKGDELIPALIVFPSAKQPPSKLVEELPSPPANQFAT